MTRALSALVLSLIVAIPAAAQTPAAAPAPAPKTIVNLVRDAIAENDFRKAEQLARADMKAIGRTPLAIEAFSWLGRGALAKKQYDVAMTYADSHGVMRKINAEPTYGNTVVPSELKKFLRRTRGPENLCEMISVAKTEPPTPASRESTSAIRLSLAW